MRNQALCKTEAKAMDRLGGIAPVTDDWHARMTLVKVTKMLVIS